MEAEIIALKLPGTDKLYGIGKCGPHYVILHTTNIPGAFLCAKVNLETEDPEAFETQPSNMAAPRRSPGRGSGCPVQRDVPARDAAQHLANGGGTPMTFADVVNTITDMFPEWSIDHAVEFARVLYPAINDDGPQTVEELRDLLAYYDVKFKRLHYAPGGVRAN